MRPFNLVQITDCHLGAKAGDELLGLNTDESLNDVLEVIKACEKPDMLLVTGDISNDTSAESYVRFVEIMANNFPGVPLAWLPGNHDDPQAMAKVSPRPIEEHKIVNGWNMIFLDSRIPRSEGGNIPEHELKRLDTLLAEYPDAPAMVFLHHQAVPVGCKWVDQYVLKNADAFFAVIDQYPNVRTISWGHVHQEFNGSRNGVALIATPSTCVQFTPNSAEFKVDTIMPGYRTYKIYENGTYNTEVKRVAEKSYTIDFASGGY